MSLAGSIAKFAARELIGGALSSAGQKLGEAVGERIGRRINPPQSDEDIERMAEAVATKLRGNAKRRR